MYHDQIKTLPYSLCLTTLCLVSQYKCALKPFDSMQILCPKREFGATQAITKCKTHVISLTALHTRVAADFSHSDVFKARIGAQIALECRVGQR